MVKPPAAKDLAIPARYYARVSEVLAGSGVDVRELLAPLGLRLERLLEPEATLALSQVDQLVQDGIARTGRTDLGFELGRVLKLSSHSIVGFGMLSSPSVDYALRLAARFFGLIMPAFRMRYRRNERHCEILFEPVAAMSHVCLLVHLEAMAVATHVELRELLQGQMPDYSLFLGMVEPPHAARYAELREARCQFGAMPVPQVKLVLPVTIAAPAPAMADAAALHMAEQRCDALVRQAVAQQQVSAWTRMMLREASDGMPSLSELAHTLNLSARTLDRHLQREGAGFRELQKQTRRDKACELLRDSRQSITTIAHELGYSDAANFSRAFRRECGISPSQYRQGSALADSRSSL